MPFIGVVPIPKTSILSGYGHLTVLLEYFSDCSGYLHFPENQRPSHWGYPQSSSTLNRFVLYKPSIEGYKYKFINHPLRDIPRYGNPPVPGCWCQGTKAGEGKESPLLCGIRLHSAWFLAKLGMPKVSPSTAHHAHPSFQSRCAMIKTVKNHHALVFLVDDGCPTMIQ